MAHGSANYLLVGAIDLGTTYSGYAFSTRHDFKRDPRNISCINWTAGSGIFQKTSTCVLFNPDGDFHSFGFEAEDEYSDLAYENKHHNWYFFRRFKMELYEQKALNRQFLLVTNNKKTMSAIKVISACIRYLKDKMLDKCHERGLDVSVNDMKWIITVPAIWDEPAKQFMREAANQAGLPMGNHLMLCLEPEAASIWCKHSQLVNIDDASVTKLFGKRSRFMVIDAGGGTIDITVYKVEKNGSLEELEMANGGYWGGTKVNDQFESFLCEILGKNAVSEFQKNYVIDMTELQRNFEIKKRKLSSDTSGIITFTIPMRLVESFQHFNRERDITSVIQSNPKYRGKIEFKRDKLRIDADVVKSFFESSLQNISEHVEQLLHKPNMKGLNVILMVGGYSESRLLQETIKRISLGIRVIVPQDPVLSVLKGAVIHGHVPSVITARIWRYTYGVSIRCPFNPYVHKTDYMVIDFWGNKRVRHIFQVHAKKGDYVKEGKQCQQHKIMVTEPNERDMTLKFFASTSESPLYTTDESCIKLGEMHIGIPDTSLGMKRGVKAAMVFERSQIQVIAKDINTGKKQIAYFDFLG